MSTITAEEISKQLPLKVKARTTGMFAGHVIRFFECRNEPGKDWQLVGISLDGKKHLIELQKDSVYETITWKDLK